MTAEPRVTTGCGLSNTHPSNTRTVASCCDTLHLGYRWPLLPAVVEVLERKRELLLSGTDRGHAAWDASEAETDHVVGETRFALRPCLQHGYRYRLLNGDVTLLLHPCPPKNLPSIRAQFSSAFLWREGAARAIELVTSLARELAEQTPNLHPPIVTRLDLCADFQGWIPTANDRLRFVGRYSKRAMYEAGVAFTGLTFGVGVLLARIYDKTAELKSSGKDWMHEVWARGGYDPAAPVWRLEFQFRRDCLRELGVDVVGDLAVSLGKLWRYATTGWLRLILPIRDTRRERQPVDPAWKVLQRAYFDSIGGEAVRVRKRSSDLEKLLSQVEGGLISLAALHADLDPSQTLARVGAHLGRRLARDGVAFSDLAARRALHFAGVSKATPSLRSQGLPASPSNPDGSGGAHT